MGIGIGFEVTNASVRGLPVENVPVRVLTARMVGVTYRIISNMTLLTNASIIWIVYGTISVSPDTVAVAAPATPAHVTFLGVCLHAVYTGVWSLPHTEPSEDVDGTAVLVISAQLKLKLPVDVKDQMTE